MGAARALGIAEKAILGLIAGAAAAVGIIDLVFLVQRVITLGTAETLTVTGVPVTTPANLADLAVIASTYETISITATGLPTDARSLLAIATVLSTLVVIGVCAVLVWLCLRVFVGRPFVASATWGIGGVAILVIVGGLGGSLLQSVAHSVIVQHLALGPAEPPTFSVDLAPLGWGLALAVVAGAFEIGQRLQRDTDGLV